MSHNETFCKNVFPITRFTHATNMSILHGNLRAIMNEHMFSFFRTMVVLEKQDNEVFGFEVQVGLLLYFSFSQRLVWGGGVEFG